MERNLLNKYTREVVEPLLVVFGTVFDQSELVGSHQSCVYKSQVCNRNIYIRITIDSHRSFDQISAELDMMIYLKQHGFNCVEPIKSYDDNLIECRAKGDYQFFAVAFTEAMGLGVGHYPWSLEVPFRVGSMVATLHNLLEPYSLRHINRPEWYENTFLVDARSYLPKNNELVLDRIDEIIDQLKLLPVAEASYGLIHGDMLAANYNMTDEVITLFDFDESSFCWYINDIAIDIFYSSLGWKGIVDVEDTKESFLELIKGYRSVRDIDDYWISTIPLFLRLREVILYVAIHRSQNLDNLDDWTLNFMERRKEKIERGETFVNLNFLDLL